MSHSRINVNINDVYFDNGPAQRKLRADSLHLKKIIFKSRNDSFLNETGSFNVPQNKVTTVLKRKIKASITISVFSYQRKSIL